jgi:hypothetical protein
MAAKKEFSPREVVVTDLGHTVPPRKAREEYGIEWEICFVRRGDGWSLGTPLATIAVAFETWKEEWSHVVRRHGETLSVEEWLQTEEGQVIRNGVD